MLCIWYLETPQPTEMDNGGNVFFSKDGTVYQSGDHPSRIIHQDPQGKKTAFDREDQGENNFSAWLSIGAFTSSISTTTLQIQNCWLYEEQSWQHQEYLSVLTQIKFLFSFSFFFSSVLHQILQFFIPYNCKLYSGQPWPMLRYSTVSELVCLKHWLWSLKSHNIIVLNLPLFNTNTTWQREVFLQCYTKRVVGLSCGKRCHTQPWSAIDPHPGFCLTG